MRFLLLVLLLLLDLHPKRSNVAANQFYNVYYEIRLLETGKMHSCLQCFAVPCRSKEMRVRPLDSFTQCCRPCSVVGPGKLCAVYREHPPDVCDQRNKCDSVTQTCVKRDYKR